MREMLFRGKRVDNGEWEYGCVVEDWSKKNTKPNIKIHNNIGKFAVIPETVGQYTGLCDKNGKKVFEGDIVIDKYDKEKFGFVGIVIYNPTLTQFQIYSDKQPDYVVNLGSRRQSVKVLGNIHDNPELVKGGAV